MICPRCSVKIDDKTVIFSYGQHGTLEKLYARVCRHTDGKGCINSCKTYVQSEDYGKIPTTLNHGEMAKELMGEMIE